MSSRMTSRRFKKSVTFHQHSQNLSKQQFQATPNQSRQSQLSINSKLNSKSQMSSRKIFSIEECKFMSMKHINFQSNIQQSRSFQPITKLKQQIAQMEDILVKNQRTYIRKIKNLGQLYQKQCEKQINLVQKVMELRNQLKKNLKALQKLKMSINIQKENIIIKTEQNPSKLSAHKRRFKYMNSPYKIIKS